MRAAAKIKRCSSKVVAKPALRYILLHTETRESLMAKFAKKSKMRAATNAPGEHKNGARKKGPASVTLRTKAGRRVLTSPAKSATSLASWSHAFAGK